MTKRIMILLTALVAAVMPAVSGCSYEKEKNGRLSIVTTSFPPYDFARAVTGDTADIHMLLSTGAEAHSYEPTPLDIARIQQCDVFICIGGEDEVWVDKILDSIDTSDIKVIKLFDYAELLEEEEVRGASPNGHHHHHHDDEDDADHDDHEDEHDEEVDEMEADGHIWTSPENAVRCVRGIEEELCTEYPENEELYRSSGESYISRLEELDEKFREMTDKAQEKTIVIGDRFPFRYLSHEYGIEYFAAFSGCSSESEPSVRTMAYLMDEIKEHDMDTVFYLDLSTKKLAEKLCAATGADMLPLYACHNVSKSDFEDGITYIDLMEKNLENLREALY
ncbi:MAG: zinc ABC transporter substrate-binding protein [Ruminococcus sp.]|nr:zinc ABC transporter substrate-binding protein [Ruminococcus sp.]